MHLNEASWSELTNNISVDSVCLYAVQLGGCIKITSNALGWDFGCSVHTIAVHAENSIKILLATLFILCFYWCEQNPRNLLEKHTDAILMQLNQTV